MRNRTSIVIARRGRLWEPRQARKPMLSVIHSHRRETYLSSISNNLVVARRIFSFVFYKSCSLFSSSEPIFVAACPAVELACCRMRPAVNIVDSSSTSLAGVAAR